MPDTRGDIQNKKAETITVSDKQAGQRKPSGLRRWFPHLACLMVIGGEGFLTYYMDSEVMAGRLSAIPYLLLAVMFAAIFVAHYFVYRED